MPKYRSLTKEELTAMESDFIKFLVLNGLAADDWIRLKEEDQEAAIRITEAFSDVVFEKILRQTEYIEFIDDHDIYCIQCLTDKMILVGAKSDGQVNFKSATSEDLSTASIKIYTTEKHYKEDRQDEIYQMLQQGYQISKGDLFKRLCLAL